MSEECSASVLYTVACRPFDGAGESDSLLCSVRKEALGGRTVKGSSENVENGLEVRVRYKIGPGCFQWRKICGKVVLQESFRQKSGEFCLLEHNLTGALVSKISYGTDLRWIKTAYYEGNIRPCAVLVSVEGGLELLQLDPSSRKYSRIKLLPCPLHPGTALQSYVNSAAGEPQICARTDAGPLCYCPEQDQKLRLSILEQVKKDGGALKAELPGEETVDINFEYIPNASIDLKLNQTPQQGLPMREGPVGKTRIQSGGGSEREPVDRAVPMRPDYAANHELFHVDPPAVKTVSEAASGPESCEPASVQTPPPKKYGVASKGLSGGAARSGRLRQPCDSSDGLFEDHLIPAKRIVVSSVESYLYFGKILNGLRQGQGRTQMPNGHTAYEGEYINDQRDGFGVYYYKSGRLCYAGGWKRNLRNGMGVAFGSRDGSIFVGNWKDNIPTGKGSAFDMDGNLIYTGEWENGLRHGSGTEYRDGRIVHTGEWQNDRFYAGYRYVEKPSPPGEKQDAVD